MEPTTIALPTRKRLSEESPEARMRQATHRSVSWCVSSISSASMGKGLELLYTTVRTTAGCRTLRKGYSHVGGHEVVPSDLELLLVWNGLLLVIRAARALVATPQLGEALDPFGLVGGGGGRHGGSACANTGGAGSSGCGAGTGTAGGRGCLVVSDEETRKGAGSGFPVFIYRMSMSGKFGCGGPIVMIQKRDLGSLGLACTG